MFMQNILLIVQDKKRGIAGSVGGFLSCAIGGIAK